MVNTTVTEALAAARSAWHAGDQDGARAAWLQVDAGIAEWVAEARALSAAGLFDAAETLLAVVTDKWPDAGVPHFEYAMLAQRRGDHRTAAARFSAVCRRFPTDPEAWVLGLRTLRGLEHLDEAAALAAEGIRALPENVAVLLECAAVAELRGDLTTVRLLCGQVRTLQPQNPDAYIVEARASRAAGELDAAANVLAAASGMNIQHLVLRVEACIIAEARKDFVEMARLAAKLRQDYPSTPEAYELALRSHLAAGELDAAEALFASLPPPISAHLGLVRIGCNLAMRRQDAELALRRHADAVERFPDSGEFHGMMTVALRNAGRQADAEAFAEMHMARFPSEPRLAIEFARGAEVRRALELAVRRWENVRLAFPNMPDGYVHSAGLLLALGRFDEAEAVAAAGHARFPDDPFTAIHLANCASRRRDWPEALRRWERALQRFPGAPEIAAGIADVHLKLALEYADERELPVTQTRPVANEALRELVMRFESLGSNCEFGIVQRLAGAEPLGLLRWGTIGVDQLRRMLETRCGGVGASETMRLNLAEDGEYQLSDLRYFSLHTLLYTGQTAEDKLYQRMQRRLHYLSKKLMDDLIAGEKIFVYRQHHAPILDTEIHALFESIRSYGPGRLLCVHKPTDAVYDNTLESPRPGLFVAYMSALTDNPLAAGDRFDLWIALLQRVEARAAHAELQLADLGPKRDAGEAAMSASNRSEHPPCG